ncbi:MAG TPA: hypothetical protein VF950_27495 [Planctomycetota bacterium]
MIPFLLALAAVQDDLADPPLSLLAGRLTARFPAGAVLEPRSRGLMSAPEADERETRVVWTSGARKFVIMAYEQLETAGDDLVNDVRGVVKTWEGKFTVAPFDLKGLRACSIAPAEIDPAQDAVFLLGLFTAREDRTVQHVAIYANPEAAKDLAGAAALAKKIAESVAPGKRELAVAAGRRVLHEVEGRKLTIELSEGFVLTTQKGPDFKVASLVRLVPLGRPRPLIGVYVGGHPRFHHERADPPVQVAEEAGKCLEKDVQWQLWKGVDAHFAEAILPLPDSRERLLHVFASGPDAAGLKALRAALPTLKLEPAK